MIPPDITNDNYRGFQSLAATRSPSARNAGVKHAVTLSSFGADKAKRPGRLQDCTNGIRN